MLTNRYTVKSSYAPSVKILDHVGPSTIVKIGDAGKACCLLCTVITSSTFIVVVILLLNKYMIILYGHLIT